MNDHESAFEELKLLQSIIARQDDFKAKTKVLVIAFLSAITVGYYSGQLPLAPFQYLATAFAIAAAGILLESSYGATEINAENRVKEVEKFLNQSKSLYDGPKISDAMLQPFNPQAHFDSIKRTRTLLFYGLLIVSISIGAWAVRPNAVPDDPPAPETASELESLKKQIKRLKADAKKNRTRHQELASSIEELEGKIHQLLTDQQETKE